MRQLPSRNRLKLSRLGRSQSLVVNGACLIWFILIVLVCLGILVWSCAIRLANSTSPDQLVPKGELFSSPLVIQSRLKRRLPVPSNNLPLWNDLSKKSMLPLTGSYEFKDDVFCSSPSEPCYLYFPTIDLMSVIETDEATNILPLSWDEMMMGLDPWLNHSLLVPNSSVIEYPSVLYTDKLVSSPNHALLTRKGFKGADIPNQDRALLLSPFHTQNDLLMAIFDGHGEFGHDMSHQAALTLPLEWPTLWGRNDMDLSQALTDTFLDMDRSLPIMSNSSGCTAIVLLKVKHILHIASAGDSTAFVASYDSNMGTVEIVYQTKPHKAHLPEERARIEAAGGDVYLPPDGTTSRVLIPYTGGVIGLAMSRCLGDHLGRASGVIANPTVDTLDLSKVASLGKQLFAVAATDGIFDHVPPLEVAQHLADNFYKKEGVKPLAACEQLIMKASELWISGGIPYRDDITIAVSKLLL